MILLKCKPSLLTLAVFCHVVLVSTAFLVPKQWQAQAQPTQDDHSSGYQLSTRNAFPSSSSSPSDTSRNVEKNNAYIEGLMSNLGIHCDNYIMTGSPKVRERVFNVLDQIAAEAVDDELIRQSVRMVKRAGVPMHKTYLEKFQNDVELGKTDSDVRRQEANKRKEWERQLQQQQGTSQTGEGVAEKFNETGKSAFSRRMAGSNGRPDLFMPSVLNPDSIATIAMDRNELQKDMDTTERAASLGDKAATEDPFSLSDQEAACRVSEMIAKAGSGKWDGETLSIGGLDDVLQEIKRRVWTPLAAPPQLLKELGIHPIRGLLLYGKPGCGKTLLASTLGSILSPFRPITVVSGPEILDKFVGSSEKNLRSIFDDPPPIYDTFRLNLRDGGDALSNAALHVVVMDEFDAIARSRGGSDGKGGQGDAGVARDSVVNQLLAKMDGVQPLCVPTLVIGLTNKRSLIEPALLRPGRFEVQIEIPPPRTLAQRISILKVHTKHMFATGRLQVNDPPPGTAAAHHLEKSQDAELLSYEGLLEKLAVDCDGFSGAALAGVARAAASHALERAVEQFSESLQNPDNADGESPTIMECLVSQDDFYEAIKDVQNSMGTHDYSEDLLPVPKDSSEDSTGK